jgi:hypothetical protein
MGRRRHRRLQVPCGPLPRPPAATAARLPAAVPPRPAAPSASGSLSGDSEGAGGPAQVCRTPEPPPSQPEQSIFRPLENAPIPPARKPPCPRHAGCGPPARLHFTRRPAPARPTPSDGHPAAAPNRRPGLAAARAPSESASPSSGRGGGAVPAPGPSGPGRAGSHWPIPIPRRWARAARLRRATVDGLGRVLVLRVAGQRGPASESPREGGSAEREGA